ncbi:MAG: hypothetical protein RL685_1309 [Pseudomonadota bacterium]
MPVSEDPRPSLGVALDLDLQSRPDALLAVAMLNGLTARGEAARIGVNLSRPSLTTARLADVIVDFYSTLPLNGGFSPIGMPAGSLPVPDAPALAAVLARKNADGSSVYTSSIQRLVDTAESAVLLRNLLLGQPDGNATIVLAGPAKGLARLLDLHGARSLLAAKVKQLVLAVGAFPGNPIPGGGAEPSVASDVPAARRLLAEWPTPVLAVGAEVGEALRYPSARLVEGLSWSAAHPIADACRALRSGPHDTPHGVPPHAHQDSPTTALAALLYAVQPDAGYFQLSAPGTLAVLEDGRTRFTPSASGRHRYLIADPAQKARLLATYVSLVSAQPVPRPARFKPPPANAAPAAGVAMPQPGAGGRSP